MWSWGTRGRRGKAGESGAAPRCKRPRVTSDGCIVPPDSSRCPGTHPELFSKLFVFPEAISHHELGPLPPSPPPEGPTNPLAPHRTEPGLPPRGLVLGDNKVLEVPPWSQTPGPCREQRDLEAAANASQDIPHHSLTLPSEGASQVIPILGWVGRGHREPAGRNTCLDILDPKRKIEGRIFPPLPNWDPLHRV